MPDSNAMLDVGALTHFFEKSAVPTLLIDLAGRSIVAANESALEFLGLPARDVLGRPGADFLAEPTVDQVLRLRALSGDETRTMRQIRTTAGDRLAEINLVPSGIDSLTFVEAIDFTDLLHANGQLQDQAASLADQARQLTTVASRIAHDVQGPLASISGFSTLLLNDDIELADAERTDMMRRIGAAAKSMGEMTRAILTDAISARGGDADTSNDPSVLAAGLRRFFDIQLAEAGGILAFETNVSRLPVPVSKLRQPITNLIANSIRYRSPDRDLAIVLRIDAAPGRSIVSVTDNGRGVPDPTSIFETGERGASAQGTDGTGLGLSFSRAAIEDLGGTITAETPDDGVGARFVIELPVEATPSSSSAALGGTVASGLTASQLDEIFTVSPLPTLLVDGGLGRIVRANDAVQALFGAALVDTGRELSDLLPGFAATDTGSAGPVMADAVSESGDRLRLEAHCATVAGSTIVVIQFVQRDDPDTRT